MNDQRRIEERNRLQNKMMVRNLLWGFTVLFSLLMVFELLFGSKALAYDLRNDGRITYKHSAIEIWINPKHCRGYLDQIEEWVKVYDYILPISFTVAGYTDLEIGRNSVWTAGCDTFENFLGVHNMSIYVSGFARAFTLGGRTVENDILLLEGRSDKLCLVGHEIGHMLGLGHSESRESIMKSGGCKSEYLLPDDLLGLADLYDVAPNCVGHVTEDLDIYLPYLPFNMIPRGDVPVYKGEWVLFEYVDGLDWAIKEFGKSLEGDWQCHLEWSGLQQTLFTEILYEGNPYNIAMSQEDGLWELRLD